MEFGILQVKLDEFVKPSKVIADYRTDITGITATDLDGVTCSLADVQVNLWYLGFPRFMPKDHSNYFAFLQKSLKKLLSHGKILVGHSLYNDLRGKPTSQVLLGPFWNYLQKFWPLPSFNSSDWCILANTSILTRSVTIILLWIIIIQCT